MPYTQIRTISGTRRALLKGTFWVLIRQSFGLPLVLWTALWLAINTGPGNLTLDGGLINWINAARASLPLLALGISALGLLSRKRRHHPTTVEIGFLLYGLVMFLSSLPVDPWFESAYWVFAFCSVMTVTQLSLTTNDPVQAARQLNCFSWGIATLVLVVLIFFARQALFDEGVQSGYGVTENLSTFAGGAMSRSSGLSRLAAVPAIIALVYIFRGEWRSRLIAAMAFSAALFIIWFMQSRGALFSFLGAFLFVLFLGGRTARRIGFSLVIGILLLWLANFAGGIFQDLWQHATRGTGGEGFQDMSGRTEIWREAVDRILQAPFIGYGAQADRRILGQLTGINNAQNALLYALLNTGFVGASFFILAMFAAWRDLFWLLFIRRGSLQQTDQLLVMITGAMLVFNTLRSIPENNAALFSIDLLLQYPAMVYLAVLTRKVKRNLQDIRQPMQRRRPEVDRFAHVRRQS